MFSKLSKHESELIRCFCEFYPSWKDILRRQIRNSQICRVDMESSYFVDFDVARNVEPAPCDVEVPIEIIVGEVDIPPTQILRRVNGYVVTKAYSFFVPDAYALGVQIHFKAGYLSELEVFSLAGKRVRLQDIEGKEVTYIILT